MWQLLFGVAIVMALGFGAGTLLADIFEDGGSR
jgi:hypothetical protein